MTVFANFPDRSDDMRIPFCLDWSVHSGYLTVGSHSGHALLYRYYVNSVLCGFCSCCDAGTIAYSTFLCYVTSVCLLRCCVLFQNGWARFLVKLYNFVICFSHTFLLWHHNEHWDQVSYYRPSHKQSFLSTIIALELSSRHIRQLIVHKHLMISWHQLSLFCKKKSEEYQRLVICLKWMLSNIVKVKY